MQDWQLIRRYVDERSEAAFAELVNRYLKLVYNTCLRDVRDPQMAEDASQVVFLVLSRKAAGFAADIALPCWLFHTARFAAKTALREDYRNKRREQRAGEAMALNAAENTQPWDQIDGMLNDALSSLPANDREVVLLRYFEGLSFTEIGGVLKTTEDTANKRTMRAVDKLRKYLTARHVAVTVATLGGLLTAHSVEAAPASSWLPLSQAISASAAATVGINLANIKIPELAQGVIHQMFIPKLKTALLIGGIVLGGVGIVPLTAHVLATAHRVTPKAAVIGAMVGVSASPQSSPSTILGPAEEKLLAHLAKYPIEIKSLSAHIQAHYIQRRRTIGIVGRPDGSEVAVPQAAPLPDQDGDWAFSGGKLYNSQVFSFDMDGSPVREKFYHNDHMWDIVEVPKSKDWPMYRNVRRDGVGGSIIYRPGVQGPLACGYFNNQDWLADSLRKTGFKVVGSEQDPKYGTLVEVVIQEAESLNPQTIHLWLAENHGLVCVKRDDLDSRLHCHWEATSLVKIGKFWMPESTTYTQKLKTPVVAGKYTIAPYTEQHTEKFSDIHINDVPDSTFQHNLPAGTEVWGNGGKSGKQLPWILDAAGNLSLKATPFR